MGRKSKSEFDAENISQADADAKITEVEALQRSKIEILVMNAFKAVIVDTSSNEELLDILQHIANRTWEIIDE